MKQTARERRRKSMDLLIATNLWNKVVMIILLAGSLLSKVLGLLQFVASKWNKVLDLLLIGSLWSKVLCLLFIGGPWNKVRILLLRMVNEVVLVEILLQELGITALHIKLRATGGNKGKTPGPDVQSALRALACSGMKMGRIGKYPFEDTCLEISGQIPLLDAFQQIVKNEGEISLLKSAGAKILRFVAGVGVLA